jgi:hypothetical protein
VAAAVASRGVVWDTDLSGYGKSAACIEFADTKEGSEVTRKYERPGDPEGAFRVMIYGSKPLKDLTTPTWTVQLNSYDPLFILVGIDDPVHQVAHLMKPNRPGLIYRSSREPDVLWYAAIPSQHKNWKQVTFTADLKKDTLGIVVDGIDYGTPFNSSPDKKPLHVADCLPCIYFYRVNDLDQSATLIASKS